MDYSQALEILGGLFGCWAAGYSVAFIIKAVKQFSEKI